LSDVKFLFLIVLAMIGLFARIRLPLVVVAMGSALALYVTGILALDQVFRGFALLEDAGHGRTVGHAWRSGDLQLLLQPDDELHCVPACKVPGCVLKRLGMVPRRLSVASTTFSNSIKLAERRRP
jgi:hypothetical protein